MNVNELPDDVRSSFLAGFSGSNIRAEWQGEEEVVEEAETAPVPEAYVYGHRLASIRDFMRTADHWSEVEEDEKTWDLVASEINAKYGPFVYLAAEGGGGRHFLRGFPATNEDPTV